MAGASAPAFGAKALARLNGWTLPAETRPYSTPREVSLFATSPRITSPRRVTETLPLGCPERSAISAAVALTRARAASRTSTSRSVAAVAGLAVALDVIAEPAGLGGALASGTADRSVAGAAARARRGRVAGAAPVVTEGSLVAAASRVALVTGAASHFAAVDAVPRLRAGDDLDPEVVRAAAGFGGSVGCAMSASIVVTARSAAARCSPRQKLRKVMELRLNLR